jgi:hypothetical protein
VKRGTLFTCLLAFGLPVATYAQPPQRPTQLPDTFFRTSPELEKARDIISWFNTKPDLLALIAGVEEEACRFVGVKNQGFRPAPGSVLMLETHYKHCETLPNGSFACAELWWPLKPSIDVRPLEPGEIFVIELFPYRGRLKDGLVRVVADSGEAVAEAFEGNNQMVALCN